MSDLTRPSLSTLEATRICLRYGASLRHHLGDLAQAREYHGTPAVDRAGRAINSWGVRDGYWNAAALFDGYVAEQTRANRCDALAAADFEERAYGRKERV